MSYKFLFEGAKYEVCGDDCCLLDSISGDHDHFMVPSAVLTSDGKEYRVTSMSQTSSLAGGSSATISFDESSEITGVSASLIGCCRSVFFLPPKAKRIICSYQTYFPKIISETSGQRFLSTAGNQVIMNHFPLELAYQHSPQHQFFIRETIRFIGCWSFFSNMNIRKVVFPSSIESIGDYSFSRCVNLRSVRFKKNSRLKTIGYQSFESTAIDSVDLPLTVEKIGKWAFCECRNLELVTFHEDSKLEIIGDGAFYNCKSLWSVRYLNKSKIRKIGTNAFFNCKWP